MGKYEIMYILTATLDDEARKNEISKLQKILESEKIAVSCNSIAAAVYNFKNTR